MLEEKYTVLLTFIMMKIIAFTKQIVAFPIRECSSSRSRRFYASTSKTTMVYIDEWFETIKKSKEFYERFSNNNDNDNNDNDDDNESNVNKNRKSSSSSRQQQQRKRKRRYYFYNIDLQGRLFLEETSPKNITSSIKDTKFLNFFFSKIRCATVKEIDFLREEMDDEEDSQYPFVSKCGFEINYIRPAATPIVFHTLVTNNDDRLLYGGNLSVQFDSNRLAISKRSGKLYYPVHNNDNDNNNSEDRMKLGYGLISSSVAVTLSDKITIGNNSNNYNRDDDDKEGKFTYNNDTEIGWLPSKNEPGKWSLPDDDE